MRKYKFIAAVMLLFALCACAAEPVVSSGADLPTRPHITPEGSGIQSQPFSTESAKAPQSTEAVTKTQASSQDLTQPHTQESVSASSPDHPDNKRIKICLDAGHQGKANTEKEPLGPGSTEMKTKVATGTQGRSTGVPEYIVTLQVALKLQKILEERGYEVLMIRTTHDVNISNAERAQIANEAAVDAFVRLHCNGVDNPEVNGILSMCQTRNNPWNGDQYEAFKRLGQCIVDEACKTTGAKNMGIQETDAMTGINWCQVPTALVEMGFMTNPEEDAKLISDAYQDLLAEGVANGLDVYFGISR